MSEPNPKTWAQRLFGFCVLLLGAALLLWLAIQVLGRIWGWLLLLAGLAAVIWVVVAIVRHRRNRW